MRLLVSRSLAALLFLALLPGAGMALAQSQRKYTGPRPPKPDVPFLLHVGKLIEAETLTATESQTKDGSLYTISGAASSVRTPVPEPIFLFQSDKVNPDKLTLFKMESRGGSRTLLLPAAGKRKKDGPRPLFVLVSPLAPGLFKVEVNEILADGEYCMSPEGSNQVFCFTAY
ncbi:MAG: hypothetical protein HY821_06955 [Acidobacteria bacterium]|nr:hypothetical protein [Acidobacteriota bacterium]